MNQNISSLNLPPNKIKEIQFLGYNYCNDINNSLEDNGLNLSNWLELIKAPVTTTALEILQEELRNSYILTFNKDLDTILKYEISTGCITEFAGYPATSKTQICLHLCVSVQLPKSCGGIEGEAVYINTNKNFASHRLKEIAQDFIKKYEQIRTLSSNDNDFSVDSVLNRIHYLEASDTVELLGCIKYLESWLADNTNIRLLIIDSITYPLRQINFTERTNIIYEIFRSLHALAALYKFAIVITNDITTKVNNIEIYNTPSLGNGFYHCVNSRILLSKKSVNLFNAKLLKSSNSEVKDVDFYL